MVKQLHKINNDRAKCDMAERTKNVENQPPPEDIEVDQVVHNSTRDDQVEEV